MSLLVIQKILWLLVDTLTAHDKHSFHSSDNLIQAIQMQLSKKQQQFFLFFLYFWNLDQVLNIFLKKRWPSRLMYFRTCRLRRTCWDKCLEGPVSQDPLTSNIINNPRTLLKSSRKHHHYIYWSLWVKLSLNKSLLVIQKILGLLVNTLTTDDKYSLLNTDCRWQAFSSY